MRGFTLLETLVAVVLLGLVVIGLGQSLRLGTFAWARQSREVVAHDDLAGTERVLRRLIEMAEPWRNGSAATFSGVTDKLAFRTILPGGRVADAIIESDTSDRLVLRMVTALGAEEHVLRRGIDRLAFAYWAPDRGWQGAWQETRLPRLVRIAVIPKEGGRHWPEIIARPRRDGDQ